MLNLYDYLSPLDNTRIKNYITLYGTENNYIGNEEWLKHWRDNKKKLFRLLGGQLIYKIPYEYVKPIEASEMDLKKLYYESEFFIFARNEIRRYCVLQEQEENPNKDLIKVLFDIDNLFSINTFISNSCPIAVKYKDVKNNKTLQLQIGGKLMKALQKVINFFFPDDKRLQAQLEEVRIKHSQLLNDTKIKGNLCLSIHPLDFMTISDNNSNWQSCMNWMNSGCYHEGTVEMMNSNNVICAYIESKNEPFYFYDNNHKSAEFLWNNKKWRQLFYCTKEIILSGKAYPYQQDYITRFIIEKLRELAQANWHRSYQFGIEEYNDMLHIGSMYRMSVNRSWIINHQTTKHNIIIDTKGMYNDFFNDHEGSTTYWCIRNKVKKNTIISVSGKAPCLCCRNEITTFEDYLEDDGEDAYNSRYGNTNKLICDNCFNKKDKTCSQCGNNTGVHKTIQVGKNDYLCVKCYMEYMKVCPDCGKVFYNKPLYVLKQPNMITKDVKYWDDLDLRSIYTACPKCMKKQKTKKITLKWDPNKIHYPWEDEEKEFLIIDRVFDKEEPDYIRHLKFNLEKPILPKELELHF